ncbi:MAG: isoprenylcysteine carboxylmethyltransferase family protein [Acetobacteraceae bacterium]|nr:isoprenylcysteine carboxylmethyltransferase family protein [Acetobacteraceae bacterium]
MASDGDIPGVIAPPPLLFLGTLAVGLALDFGLLRVPTGLPGALRFGAAAALAAAAVGLAAAALGRFRRAGTAVEPWRPSTALVTDGVYRFTRNPIYLAMALLYLGLSLAADSALALVLLPPLLASAQVGVVSREERYLERRFGDDYRRYCSSVRRWL